MMANKLLLVRCASEADRTLGRLFVLCGSDIRAMFVTLEPPWKDNRRGESRIPTGDYNVVPRNSPKHGDHLLVEDVPDRDLILFHKGNFPGQTEWCILVGMKLSDIDGDGKMDVSASAAALGILVQFISERSPLKVIDLDR